MTTSRVDNPESVARPAAGRAAVPDSVPTTAPVERTIPAVRFVAAIQERSSGIAVVIAECHAPGDARGPVRIIAARRFTPGAGQAAAIRGVLREHNLDLIIRVVPAGQTLARVPSLPSEASGQSGAAIAEALSLIAESELPSSLPWHRRAGGLVSGTGGLPPIPLLIGWNKAHRDAEDLVSEALAGIGVRVVWTTEAVAAAWLLGSGADAADGHAPARWVAILDRTAGVATIVAGSAEKFLVRTLRLPGSDPERWSAAVGRAIAEAQTPRTAGPSLALSDPDAPIVAPPGTNWRLGPEDRNPSWWTEFGVPAALVAAFASPDPASRGLFSMLEVEPRQRLNPLVALAAWLSRPARAAAVIAISIGMLLLVPLGVAYARHASLQRHVRGMAGMEDRLREGERRVAFYSLLKERRWPMTKLIADIASSAPEGMTLDVLEINQGEPISVRGTAKRNELVTTFRENLVKTRVFESIAIPNVGSSADGVQFQLTARVAPAGVFYRAGPVDDFAARPLGVRIYGDSYTPPEHDEASDAAPDRARSSRRDTDGAPGRSASPGSASRSGGAAPPAVPPPLTDEQLAGFTATTAMLDFAKRKNAAAQPGIDAATKQRLLDESARSRARMQELNAAGGSGAAGGSK